MAECLFSSHQVLAIRQLETGLICESTHLPVVRSLLVQFKERHWGTLGQRLERGGEQTHLTEPHSLTQCQPEAQDSLEPSSFFSFLIFLNVYMVCVCVWSEVNFGGLLCHSSQYTSRQVLLLEPRAHDSTSLGRILALGIILSSFPKVGYHSCQNFRGCWRSELWNSSCLASTLPISPGPTKQFLCVS